MFYIDEKGAITFTNGACVNSFTLEKPLKILLTEKVVKLFKLFLSESVEFTLGFGVNDKGVQQTKARFKDSDVEITTILSSDTSLISEVPATAIRSLATASLPYTVVLDKRVVLEALSRLSLFDKNNVITIYSYLEFSDEGLRIYDTRKANYENVPIINAPKFEESYECILLTNDFKITLDTISDQYFTMSFGNTKAVLIERPNIKNILPEAVDTAIKEDIEMVDKLNSQL